MNRRTKITETLLRKWRANCMSGEYTDADTPGLKFYVSPKGKVTAFFYGRMPGQAPTRHKLGEWGPNFSLSAIREELSRWKSQIDRGVDPKDEARRQRAERERQKSETIAHVIPEWGKGMVKAGRRWRSTNRRMAEANRHFTSVFGPRAISSITRSEIKGYLQKIGDKSPAMANRLHVIITSIFSWAIDEELFGMRDQPNPCDGIKARSYGYKRKPNTKIITDEQFAAFTTAIEAAGYPYGPFIKFLLFTAARHGESKLAKWSEFDFEKKLWIIPAENTKTGHECRRPLSDPVVELLQSLPRSRREVAEIVPEAHGRRENFLRNYDPDYVWGLKPYRTKNACAHSSSQSPKRAINRHMPEDLRQWHPHLIRHTFRTIMSGHVEDNAAIDKAVELYLGHTERDIIKATYDHHKYERSMRKVAEIWANEALMRMHPSEKVIKFRRA